MRRRAIVKAVVAVAAPMPIPLLAQAPKAGQMRRIAILSAAGDGEPGPPGHRRPFAERLWRSVGWVEGETLRIERRFADGNLDRLPELVEDLLKHEPEVLIAFGEAAIIAARATRTVPIIALFVFEPERLGLIDSYQRPRRNVTGVALSDGREMVKQRMQILHELAPSAHRISFLAPEVVFGTVSGQPIPSLLEDYRATALALGLDATFHLTVRRPEDVQFALDAAVAANAQAVFILGSPFIAIRERVAAFAARQRWLSATSHLDLLNAGLLLYSGPSLVELVAMSTRMVQMTDRILRGARPGEIPMETPVRYELALNLKTARILGLTVPPSVMLRVDRVIE